MGPRLFQLFLLCAALAPALAISKSATAASVATEATPVAKVVKLLKEMQETLQKEGEEDEEMYDKLSCWCSTNDKAKTASVELAEKTISELESSIEELTASVSSLTADLEKTNAELVEDTESLNEATKLREKQQKEFHNYELDAIQNVESLKAAVIVLGKNHATMFPQLDAIAVAAPPATALLQERTRLRARVRSHAKTHAHSRGDIDHETREMDRLMLRNDWDNDDAGTSVEDASAAADKATEAFLKTDGAAGAAATTAGGDVPAPSTDDAFMQSSDDFAASDSSSTSSAATTQEALYSSSSSSSAPVNAGPGYTAADILVLRKVRRSLLAFAPRDRLEALGLVQDGAPSQPYAAQSGEILGMLKQMKETMEKKLTETQAEEKERASDFQELRAAKEQEIAEAEAMIESKTAEKAETGQKLADDQENLENTKANLDEDQKFLVNLKKMCGEADAAWEIRRKTRAEEAIAITETIEMLTSDEARDTMNRSFNKESMMFFQTRATSMALARRRSEAAALLRRSAGDDEGMIDGGLPRLSLTTLASSVQLDAFTEVKKAMDNMIGDLKLEQEDEVKKKDYCDASLQENEMVTMKTEDVQKDLQTKVEDITATIDELHKGIEAAKAAVADTQVNQQRANENRVKENQDFQRAIADAQATVEILHKALNRLAQFYDSEFLQAGREGSAADQHRHGKKQQPPVPLDGAGYSKSSGSGGVMSMIEKLISDAQDLGKEARKDEQESQINYEEMTADSSETLKKLSDEIVNKAEAVAKRTKEKVDAEESLQSTLQELEGLAGENGNLHKECDFLLKNFGIRQKARAAEIESIQEAKQILSGAQ